MKLKGVSAPPQGVERTVTEQKLEIDDLKSQINAVFEKASQEKDALKRATRAQKQRAERFEVAVGKCYDQLREKVRHLGSQGGCLGSESVFRVSARCEISVWAIAPTTCLQYWYTFTVYSEQFTKVVLLGCPIRTLYVWADLVI